MQCSIDRLASKGFIDEAATSRIVTSLPHSNRDLLKLAFGININFGEGQPPAGYVWLFDHLGRAVYDHLNQRVAVPEEFSNS